MFRVSVAIHAADQNDDGTRYSNRTIGQTMLLFKKKFLPAIRTGSKTQTIRIWKHRRMRGGQRSYIPGVGHIRVLTVDEIRLEDLIDQDAPPDGFETADALRAELESLYADQLATGQKAYRVVFELVPVTTT